MEKREEVIRVNLTGTFFMFLAVVPLMKERHWGRIINVASVAVLTGTPPFMQTSGYAASKSGFI